MIRVLESDNKIFTKSTQMPYYDSFYNEYDLQELQKYKNVTYEIVNMSPNDYYWEVHRMWGTSITDLKKQKEKNAKLYQYITDMENGDKFPMPMLDYVKKTQEGLHRMYAVGEVYGWDYEVPVMVVKRYK